jgi:hypothetical protein
MSFTSHRFNLSAFAFAAVATLTLNGTMLMGFDQLATAGSNGLEASTRLVKTEPAAPSVKLERVVISTRRA